MEVTCGVCSTNLKATDKLFGKSIRCPKCGNSVSVPNPASLSDSEQDAHSSCPIQSTVASLAEPSSTTTQLRNGGKKSKNGETSNAQLLTTSQIRLIWFGGASLLVFVLIALTVFVLRGNNRNNVAERDRQYADPGKIQNKPPIEYGSKTSHAIETNDESKAAELGSIREELPDQQTAKLTNLPAGRDIGYQIMIRETRDEGSREWTGTVMIRPESTSSPVELEQILDGGRRRSKIRLRSKRYATGIKVPNRWILVGNNLVEGAKKITVRMNGIEYEAIARHRLEKSEFAVLQIENAKLPKFRKLPIQAPNGQKLVKGPFNIFWLNSSSEINLVQNVKTTSASSYRGGVYFFTRTVPGEAVGGIVISDSGRFFGLVNDSNFPSNAATMKAKAIPFARVAKAWPEKTQKIMFDTNGGTNPKDTKSQKAAVKDRLVQVVIERETEQNPTFPIRYDVNIHASNPNRLRDFSDLKSITRIRENGMLGYTKTRNDDWSAGDSKIPQLPFCLGSVIEHVLLPEPSAGLTKWVRKRSVFIHENGIFATKKSQEAVKGMQIETFEVIEKSDSIIKIKRTVELISIQESPGSKPSDCFFALPIRLSGEQMIVYSKELCGIKTARFKGTFTANSVGKKKPGSDQYEKIEGTSKLEFQIDLLHGSLRPAWNFSAEL